MHPHRARRCSTPARQSHALTCCWGGGTCFPSQPCSGLQSCTSGNPEVTEPLPLRPALRLVQTGHICMMGGLFSLNQPLQGCCLLLILQHWAGRWVGAGFSHLSNPLAITAGEHIAPGLDQPNLFPSPQRKGKEGGRLWAWVISCSQLWSRYSRSAVEEADNGTAL